MSIAGSGYQNLQYIIVDGDSNDGTKELAAKYADYIDLFISEPDSGIYEAINKGINLASGDWILILGSDDRLIPSSLDVISGYMKDAKSAYYGNVILSSNGQVYADKFSLRRTMYENIPHQAIFYPRNYCLSNPYNTRYTSAADHVYLYNFIKIKGKGSLRYCPVIIALYNNTTGISSTRQDLLFRSHQQALIRDCYPLQFYLFYTCRRSIVSLVRRFLLRIS